MPQLHFHTFPAQIFWLVVSFVLLYWLMMKVALPRIEKIIAERRDRLDDDLEKAAAMKSEAEAVIAAYQKALADARATAQTTVKETTDRLAAEAAERQRIATAELAKRTSEAEKAIEAAKQRALGDLRLVAIDVARAATARLAGGDVEEADIAAAVDATLGGRA